jgi:hypothetical protein
MQRWWLTAVVAARTSCQCAMRRWLKVMRMPCVQARSDSCGGSFFLRKCLTNASLLSFSVSRDNLISLKQYVLSTLGANAVAVAPNMRGRGRE